MKTIKTIILLIAASCSAIAQGPIINIPDDAFKLQLLWNNEINTNLDVEIDSTEAANYTGTIQVSNMNITDVTGIEAFTAITGLYCDYNSLTFIDVSKCVNLESLWLRYNQITELDVSSNLMLIDLRIDYNSVSTLDLSQNVNLEVAFTGNNGLYYLDVKNGNNLNMTFSSLGNPDLCISVDSQVWSTSAWSLSVDPTVVFSDNCTVGINERKRNNNETVIIYDLFGREVKNVNAPGVYILKNK